MTPAEIDMLCDLLRREVKLTTEQRDLLDALTGAYDGMALRDLATRCRCTLSSMHNRCNTLAARDMVRVSLEPRGARAWLTECGSLVLRVMQ